jgi:hypothetical protein
MHVKAWMNTSSGWVMTSTEEKALSFTRTVRRSGIIVVILLLLGIIPGLLYLLTGARNETRNVYFKVLDKKKTIISLESGGSTDQYGELLTKYLAQFDDTIKEEPEEELHDIPMSNNAALIIVCVFIIIFGIPLMLMLSHRS